MLKLINGFTIHQQLFVPKCVHPFRKVQ
jgi:hypothetical protein